MAQNDTHMETVRYKVQTATRMEISTRLNIPEDSHLQLCNTYTPQMILKII
jgi:hypothetical protein